MLTAHLKSAAIFLLCALRVLCGEIHVTKAADGGKPRPNIVVILADDLGYGDVSCNNPERGKIRTPHVDRLAGQGTRFTDAHSASGVCSPSRYALLTGRYPWRTRLQKDIVRYLEPPLIAGDRLTLPGLLKQQGYHTACIGKWHLGWDWTNITASDRELFYPDSKGPPPMVTERHLAAWRKVYSQPIEGGPITHGFDTYFGTDVPNWPPYCFIEQNRTVGIPTVFIPEEMRANKKAGLRGPMLAGWKLEGILPALTDRACETIRRHAKASDSKPFFIYMPLTSPHTPIAVNDEFKGKSGLDVPVADFIVETDAAVGRVLDALDEAGVADNTLVIFTSDNGFAPYAGAKELQALGHYPSGPLRGYKADGWEGGHRIPFIVRWPGQVPAGRVSGQLVQQADIMRTVADILGTTLPDNAAEDSTSILPLLRGEDRPVHEHIVNQALNGLHTLRRGSWKIMFGPIGGGYKDYDPPPPADAPSVQLYNLADDLAETKNLAREKPELVAELSALMEKLVNDGRSTPGAPQHNDVEVEWRKFMTGK